MNSDHSCSENQHFSPIFVVGAPRSGTTILSVLLDRHSRISIPPETQFFTEFLPSVQNEENASREEKVRVALSFHRLKDLELGHEEVMAKFRDYDNSYQALFQALLEAYCEKHMNVRPGEKSPKHIEHVPFLLQKFPGAKVICIVRDGRDVVRSLLKVFWAEPGNPRRLGIFCMEWCDYAELTIKYQNVLPREQFYLVKYERLLTNPVDTLQNICAFIGEEFEPEQLDPNFNSKTVPDWELEWKGKASGMLDSSRVEAWRKGSDQKELWRMNVMMGKTLDKLGYTDIGLHDCPPMTRFFLNVQGVPYTRWARSWALLGLKMLRMVGLVKKNTPAMD